MPGIEHVVAALPTLHWAEPDTLPETAIITFGTGPPDTVATLSVKAIGIAQGRATQVVV